jgi:hypothetical protein
MQVVAPPHDDLLRVPLQIIFYDMFTALVLGSEPSSLPTYVFLHNLCTTLLCLRGHRALFLGLYLTSGSSFLTFLSDIFVCRLRHGSITFITVLYDIGPHLARFP